MRRAVAIGIQSVRTNAVPMIVLWLMAAAAVGLYYGVPGGDQFFAPFAAWQRENGWLAAFLNRVLFCGLLPGAFLLLLPSLRPRRPVLTVLAQTLWCGLWGVVFDFYFRGLDLLWGNGTDFATLAAKMCADEFVLTAFLSAPADAVFFFWVGRDFSVRRVRADWPRSFYGELVLPNLISNWCVWVPVSFAVFAFPLALQIQVSGFAAAFWTLMCLQIGRRTKGGLGHE